MKIDDHKDFTTREKEFTRKQVYIRFLTDLQTMKLSATVEKMRQFRMTFPAA